MNPLELLVEVTKQWRCENMCIADKILCFAENSHTRVIGLADRQKVDIDIKITDNRVITHYLFEDGSLLTVDGGKYEVMQ
jgi:hypothetical protein